MADIDSEKVQFLLAAARGLKWKPSLTLWAPHQMTIRFVITDEASVTLTVDTTMPGWEDLSPGQKLTAAEDALSEAAARVPGFDPRAPALPTA